LDTLGWIYVGLKEYSLAIAELGRAVRLRPDQALTYYHLGEAYRRNQQFDQAAEMLETGRRMAVNTDDKKLLADIDTSMQKNLRRESTP
jgi:tetratricopeptide (TPR) repeat protein